ncbi:MAG: extracellular solute-binding protein [Gordonia sp. (in: high G+C Gram-positive bacteria)]
MTRSRVGRRLADNDLGARGARRRGGVSCAVAVLAVLVTGVSALVGCSESADDGDVTLHFIQNKREVIDYFDQVIAQFEKQYPHIKVVQDNNEGGFVPSLVRGSPPDVTTRGWAYLSGDLAKKDVFEDLSDLPVARRIDRHAQDLVNAWGQYDAGATVALPYSLTAAGVIYNKDLFAKYHVAVPTTWREFTAVCGKFAAAGVTPIYGTYKDSWTITQGLFDYATGGVADVADFYDRLIAAGPRPGANAPSFATTFAPALPVMSYLRTAVQSNALSRAYTDGNVAFAHGKAAMYLQGPWALSELAKSNPELRVGTFPLPVTDNAADRRVRVNVDMALSIPKGAAHPRQARQFIEFLFQDKIINAYNAANAAFSTLAAAPATTDGRIAELAPYVEDGRYYQGASTYLPPVIAFNAYLQTYAINGDGKALLAVLDREWQRVARRNANRGTN